MFTSPAQYWLAFGWHLHLLFAVMIVIGSILFISWALKQNHETVRQWIIWLFVVGILGLLLTGQYSPLVRNNAPAGGNPFGSMMNPGMMNFGGGGNPGMMNLGGGLPPEGMMGKPAMPEKK